MIALAYVIPVIACLLLKFEFDYDGGWAAYLWVILFGEGTVGALHYAFYRKQSSRKEYLGSLVYDIVHEDSWVELVEVSETRTDRNGRTYTVRRIEERYHPDRYYFHTTRGSAVDTDYNYYCYVRDLWGLPCNRLTWSGSRIRGGMRFGEKYDMADFDYEARENPANWVPVTECHKYTNKIQASNSIFKFEEIKPEQAREIGLYDYPAIVWHDAPCILSDSIPVAPEIDELFRKFNGRYAYLVEMRVFILLFDASKGIGISELQRAYWQGGNKNEFVVCIGVDDEGEVAWARVFSWADEQTVEVETAQWLMHHKQLDWMEFHDWMKEHIAGWKRKEFKDFDYINVTLPLWQILTVIASSAAENALAIYIAVC